MKNLTVSYKIAAVLWIIWGLVHIMAGVLTMKGILNNDISEAIAGIADQIDPESLSMDYSAANGAIIGQHGFNLLWVGIVTFLSAFFIWSGNRNAIFLASITGGLADLGYFLFLDLGGYVHFFPGTLMTIFSASAILLSFYPYFQNKSVS